MIGLIDNEGQFYSINKSIYLIEKTSFSFILFYKKFIFIFYKYH